MTILGSHDFAGTWRLARRITDRTNGQIGHLHGSVQLTQTEQGGLHYQEEGQLQLGGGQIMQATRAYHWQFEGTAVVVRFADGKPFHQFVPSGHVAGTDHPCGDDFYTVRYDFRRWPVWQAVWSVTGPRKDYVSVSDYIR